MSDIWTMMWKETKDEIFQGGWQASIRPLIIFAVVGIILPLQLGQQWLNFNPVAILIPVYISFFFIVNYIGDAIAGEHERHTLETLLASRIPDQAILLGKVIVTVGYTWVMVLFSMLIGALVINVSKGAGTWTFYAPFGMFVYVLTLSLLTSLLAAGGGVLVSLHSPTVRQAQQTLLLGTLGLGVVFSFLFKAVPKNLVAALNTNQILGIVLVVLAVLDVILLGIALASFKRSRLILS